MCQMKLCRLPFILVAGAYMAASSEAQLHGVPDANDISFLQASLNLQQPVEAVKVDPSLLSKEASSVSKTSQAPSTPSGYTHVGSDGMCTDNALTNWNEGIEVGQHSRSRQGSVQLCADRCGATPDCNGFVYWPERGGCRTYGACDIMRNNNHHEYMGSDAFVKELFTTNVGGYCTGRTGNWERPASCSGGCDQNTCQQACIDMGQVCNAYDWSPHHNDCLMIVNGYTCSATTAHREWNTYWKSYLSPHMFAQHVGGYCAGRTTGNSQRPASCGSGGCSVDQSTCRQACIDMGQACSAYDWSPHHRDCFMIVNGHTCTATTAHSEWHSYWKN